MSSSADKPRWLRKAGHEWEWAYDYMQKATDPGIQTRLRHFTLGKEPSYEMVIGAIAYLKESREGFEFVTRLRNALRQHRHRSMNALKKRRPYSFTLPIDTKKALSINAEQLGMTESALIRDLLEGADKSLEEHRTREKRLRNALTIQRKRMKQLDERWRVRHGEAIRQIERLTTLLSMWELTLEQTNPAFDVDEATLQSESKKKIDEIQKAINDALKRHRLLEARLI